MNWKELPNVRFTSISYEGKSPENMKWSEYMKSGRKPLQWVVDKLGKNRCWKVISAKWDIEKRAIKFTLLVNADASREVVVPYEEICSEMKWKSFTFYEKSSCVPVEMSACEVSEIYTDAVSKTHAKDDLWLKEHPDALTKAGNEKTKM